MQRGFLGSPRGPLSPPMVRWVAPRKKNLGVSCRRSDAGVENFYPLWGGGEGGYSPVNGGIEEPSMPSTRACTGV